MDEYLNMSIKPLIERFPEVGRILERYSIGCVPCAVGTCKFADVVKFHPLSPRDQAEMLLQVEEAICRETVG